MTVYEVKLGLGPYGSNVKEFIVWGSDEMNALENLYSEYHDAYPMYFRSADSFEQDVRRAFESGGWSSLDEVREVYEEDETYLDVDGGQYIGTIYSIREAPEIYQFLDYHQLKLDDPTDPDSLIRDAYGDFLVECPKCGAINTLPRGFDEYDFGGRLEWECRTCESLGDPDYVRLKDGHRIMNSYVPALVKPMSKIKSRGIKPDDYHRYSIRYKDQTLDDIKESDVPYMMRRGLGYKEGHQVGGLSVFRSRNGKAKKGCRR